MKNYYTILGVEKNATDQEIAKAYRKLAIQYHPDKNPGDEQAAQKFKEITEAFEVLNDPEKRTNYDRFGSARPQHRGFTVDPFGIFGDIFGDFGGEEMSIVAEVRCEVSMEEAYRGCRRSIDIPVIKVCHQCNGSGATAWTTCATCQGRGRQIQSQGMFQVAFTCTQCRGKGQMPQTRCDHCNGSGEVNEGIHQTEVQIPVGVAPGFSLKFPTPDAHKSGYVLCRIDVKPHPFYKRQNHDLHGAVPLTVYQLFAGHHIELPHPSGSACLIKIPPLSRPGAILRVPSMGMPALSRESVRGDLFLRLELDWPTNPTPEFVDSLKSLGEMDDKQQYDGIKAFQSQLQAAQKGESP